MSTNLLSYVNELHSAARAGHKRMRNSTVEAGTNTLAHLTAKGRQITKAAYSTGTPEQQRIAKMMK